MEDKEKITRWINTILSEVETLDNDKGRQILNRCGSECSNCFGSHQAALRIRNEAADKNDVDWLLNKMNKEYYESDQVYREGNTIYLIYPDCGCPMVKEGIKNPFLCECTLGYTKAVYETLLGKDIMVELQQSILNGDPVCRQAITIID